MIRYTARLILQGVGRAYLEEMVNGVNVDSNDRTECVATIEVERDSVTLHDEKGAIKAAIEDDTDARVVSVQILDAQCLSCYSQAPHRCECVLAAGWTDDQEEAA